MLKVLNLSLLTIFILSTTLGIAGDHGALAPEEEWLITDRDRGSREKPNLYDYNRQNVQYNKRYINNDRSDYRQQDSNYYYDPAQSMDTFNRSYYQDNTSPNLYLNR
jgi:hypothetical protein